MDKKKQIEEMSKDIYSILRIDTMSRAIASMLYDKDYRKASEVIDEVEQFIFMKYGEYFNFAELKKKYTEEGKYVHNTY